MTEQQVQDAGIRTGLGQRTEPGGPRAFRQCRTSLQPVDREHTRRDAAVRKPRCHRRRLGCRGRTQPVIDDQRLQCAAACARPGIGQQRQGHAVGAARNARGQTRRRLERPERRHRSGEFVGGGDRYLHPARCVDSPIESRRSGRGDGNSERSFANVSQAARFSLMAISELARPSMASCACAPFLERL